MNAQELAQVEKTLSESADQLVEAQKLADQIPAHPPDLNPDELSIGQRVWVITLDMHAELTRLPDHKGVVPFAACLLKIEIDLDALRKPRQGQTKSNSAGTSRKQKKNQKKKNKHKGKSNYSNPDT